MSCPSTFIRHTRLIGKLFLFFCIFLSPRTVLAAEQVWWSPENNHLIQGPGPRNSWPTPGEACEACLQYYGYNWSGGLTNGKQELGYSLGCSFYQPRGADSTNYRYIQKRGCFADSLLVNVPGASCQTGQLLSLTDRCVSQQIAFNAGSSTNNTCHPINIPTGNKFYSETDYKSAYGLTLNRSYNTLQRNWQFSYTQFLAVEENQVAVYRPDGQVIFFSKNNEQWVAPSHRRERLVAFTDGFQLTLSNNTVETYNSNGQLMSIAPVTGDKTRLQYSGNQVLVSYLNNTLVLEKNSNGHIVKAILPDNQAINYVYTGYGDFTLITQITFADLTTRQYHYEDTRFPGFITGITDSAGHRIASVIYDDQGRATSSETGHTGSGIDRTEITYNANGTRTVKNSLGKEAIYHFTDVNGEFKLTQIDGQPSTHCAAANQGYTYDSNGFMASKTDWNGTVTTYVHNAKGQETSRTEASGTPQARTITTEWHTDFNLPVAITEPKRITRFTYDAQGRLVNRLIEPRNP